MIFGIDYSYTSPAICVLGENFETSKFYFANQNKKLCYNALNYEGTLLEKDYADSVDRYEKISLWAVSKIQQHWVEGSKIYLEGYAFGARGGLLFNIAENGGMLKYHLKKAFGVHPIIVAPTAVKKDFSGKGNANKEGMVQNLLDKEGINIVQWMQMNKLGSPAHDVVDSYAIALLGKHLEEIDNGKQ
jgi:hypothetical protein